MTASAGPVLICYDGSENARYATERAATLFGGSRAVVLTVWQPTVESGGMVWFEETANLADFAELDRAAAERGGRLADEGARTHRHPLAPARQRLERRRQPRPAAGAGGPHTHDAADSPPRPEPSVAELLRDQLR